MKLTAFALSALLVMMGLESSLAADPCFRDFGKKTRFDSSNQGQALQVLAKTKCSVVGFRFAIPRRATLVVADLDNGEMIRLKLDPLNSRPWERWSGFQRADVLNDDPSDGFDLGTFRPSQGNETPEISERIRSFVEKHGASEFLP